MGLRNLYIVDKYFQCATIPSLTIRVYLIIIIIIKFAHSVNNSSRNSKKNNNRHWRRPTQVLKHLRVALKHKHKAIKTTIQNVQVTS